MSDTPTRPGGRYESLVMTSRALVPLAACVVLLAGCGGATSSSSAGDSTHRMSDGTVMKGSSMSGMDMNASSGQPSDTAAMICSNEIRTAVASTFEIGRAPAGRPAWDPATKVFSCTYQLPGGDLRLSVEDATGAAEGTAYFDDLKARLPGAKQIKGLESFGFPAFETANGSIVFLKDHKTLWVDGTRLAASGLPTSTSRTVVAYGVAAAVIACWTE